MQAFCALAGLILKSKKSIGQLFVPHANSLIRREKQKKIVKICNFLIEHKIELRLLKDLLEAQLKIDLTDKTEVRMALVDLLLSGNEGVEKDLHLIKKLLREKATSLLEHEGDFE